MNENKWTSRDWKWFIGILFGIIALLIIIIIFSLSYKLSNDRDMVNITSIGAGLVSIVLGIVAIVYAFFQARESSTQNTNLNYTIHEIDKSVLKLSNIIDDVGDIKSEINNLKASSEDGFENIIKGIETIKTLKNTNEYTKEVKDELEEGYGDLYNMMDKIPVRLEKVLRLRLGLNSTDDLPRSLEEVGREFNLPSSEISKMEAKAFEELGKILLEEKIRDIQLKLEK